MRVQKKGILYSEIRLGELKLFYSIAPRPALFWFWISSSFAPRDFFEFVVVSTRLVSSRLVCLFPVYFIHSVETRGVCLLSDWVYFCTLAVAVLCLPPFLPVDCHRATNGRFWFFWLWILVRCSGIRSPLERNGTRNGDLNKFCPCPVEFLLFLWIYCG